MTLTSGSRLGPYEIVSQLGAGSMGVVYQAHVGRYTVDALIGEGGMGQVYQQHSRFSEDSSCIDD